MESLNGVDLTGRCQHGFKKNHGTATASLLLQSMISRALDNDEYVAMASLDLSSAFDVVVSTVMSGLLFARFLIVDYDTQQWLSFMTSSLFKEKKFQSRQKGLFLGEGLKTFLALSNILHSVANKHIKSRSCDTCSHK